MVAQIDGICCIKLLFADRAKGRAHDFMHFRQPINVPLGVHYIISFLLFPFPYRCQGVRSCILMYLPDYPFPCSVQDGDADILYVSVTNLLWQPPAFPFAIPEGSAELGAWSMEPFDYAQDLRHGG
jgi:hypothetical protein